MLCCTSNSCTTLLLLPWVYCSRVFSESSQTGALSYTVPLLAPIPLQALVTREKFVSLRAELDYSISLLEQAGRIKPLQAIQYQVLRRLLDEGNVGWVEMTLVPSGGVLSTPASGKGGATVVAIQLVCRTSFCDTLMCLTPDIFIVSVRPWLRGMCSALARRCIG
jgi:hypothetical protein